MQMALDTHASVLLGWALTFKEVFMVSKDKLAEFLSRESPQIKCVVEAVGGRSATVRHSIGVDELRPGGTV
jgi:hypothetical protein